MARRQTKPKFDKKVIIEAFAEMAREKGIEREHLQSVITETFTMIIRKKYGQEANFDIIVNMDKGDIEIYLIRTVVETVTDPVLEISLEEVNVASDGEYELGEEYLEEITLENIADNFGRRLINMAGQMLSQRIKDIEKDKLYEDYYEKVGEIIAAEVHHIQRQDIFLMHNNVELRMPRNEQIPSERLRKGATVRCLLEEVRRVPTTNNPEVIVSRASNAFLAKLFEMEIPEIYDGVIEIKSIAREPGERAKVAVFSYDDRVDPVGACVGMKGIRIHSIVRELANENIDIVNYSEDPYMFIARSLSPARVRHIEIDMDTRSATVFADEDQVSLAIGRNGQNIRLASRLTGFAITLVKEGAEEDIELAEFREELGYELFDELANAGFVTAKEFLNGDLEFLLSLPGMTPAFLGEMRRIMLFEFERQEDPQIAAYLKEMEDYIAASADAEPDTEGEQTLPPAAPVLDSTGDDEAAAVEETEVADHTPNAATMAEQEEEGTDTIPDNQ